MVSWTYQLTENLFKWIPMQLWLYLQLQWNLCYPNTLYHTYIYRVRNMICLKYENWKFMRWQEASNQKRKKKKRLPLTRLYSKTWHWQDLIPGFRPTSYRHSRLLILSYQSPFSICYLTTKPKIHCSQPSPLDSSISLVRNSNVWVLCKLVEFSSSYMYTPSLNMFMKTRQSIVQFHACH